MSKQAQILANVCAFDIDKATSHRLSVTLPHDVTTAIQDVLPAAGALSWCLQHAAHNLYAWIRRQTPNYGTIHLDTLNAVISGRAFLRSTVVEPTGPACSSNEQRAVEPVRTGAATAPHTSSPARSRNTRSTKRAKSKA